MTRSSAGGGMHEAAPAGRRRVLAGLMLTMALAAMDATVVATAIPSIVRDLGGFSLFPWVFSAYVLGSAVSIPIYGKLADLYGRKPLLVIGTVVFLAGSVLSGLSWSMLALICFRGLQGLGAGAIQPMVTTLAADLYTLEERARVQGLLVSVWGIAAVVGPAIGGLFSEYASWRWIFYVNVPIGAAALLVILTGFHEPRAATRRRPEIDFAGAALLVAGVGLLILGLLQSGVRWPWGSAASVGVFAAAALLLAAFAWRERRAAEPILPPWVFGSRLLVGTALGSSTVGLLTIGVTTFLPTFAQGVLGAGPVAAGFVLAAMTLGWPLAAAWSGRLYLRIGFRDTAALGAAICLLSACLFAAVDADAALWEAAVASFVMGLGLGCLSTPLIVGVQSVADWGRRGVVTGASMFTRMLGQAVGAAVFGAIANAALHDRLASAPAGLAGELPRSVNAASDALAGSAGLGSAAAAYVRESLALATHRVFLALVAVAVASLLVLALTPRRFDPLPPGGPPSDPSSE